METLSSYDGSEWLKKHDSSYANGTDSDYRSQMAEIYPEVFEFRK